jgi:hypothetical protein
MTAPANCQIMEMHASAARADIFWLKAVLVMANLL